jgi:hypothetical protein
MTLALALSVLFLVLIGYGLERNERRQTGPKSPLAGSADVPDRDLQRIRAELAALSDDESAASDDGADPRADRRSVHGHGRGRGHVVALH